MGLSNRLWVALLEEGMGLDDLQRSPLTSASLWLCEKEYTQGERVIGLDVLTISQVHLYSKSVLGHFCESGAKN